MRCATSLLRRIGLILCGLLLAFFTGEIALRILGISYPNFWQDDIVLGSALRPGVEGWQILEGKAYVKINRAGFRDSEHQQRKPPETLRIAVLGDSYAEAIQVPVEDTFWSVMQRALRPCPALRGRKLEVLNFGVSNYGTAQELLLLRKEVWKDCTDIVVLAFTLSNDFLDNSRPLDSSPVRPFFELHQGKLVLDNSFRQSPAFLRLGSRSHRLGRTLSDYSRVLQLIYRLRVRLSNEQDYSGIPFAPPTDPVWRDAWQVTEAMLVEMRDEVQAAGAAFVVMLIPDEEQIFPDRSHREKTAARWGISDLLYADKKLQAFGDREHIAVLDLAPPFQAYTDSHHVFLNGFPNTESGYGHWNPLGHRLAGLMLARRLCETIISDREPRSCGQDAPVQPSQ